MAHPTTPITLIGRSISGKKIDTGMNTIGTRNSSSIVMAMNLILAETTCETYPFQVYNILLMIRKEVSGIRSLS